mmetsp:Transcript_15166/g.22241  ORF Transcript_15166/g.22241 Transcript_15166/m.22241 type:complete len:96 (-) Transcript_15166:1571-1858(-)
MRHGFLRECEWAAAGDVGSSWFCYTCFPALLLFQRGGTEGRSSQKYTTLLPISASAMTTTTTTPERKREHPFSATTATSSCSDSFLFARLSAAAA